MTCVRHWGAMAIPLPGHQRLIDSPRMGCNSIVRMCNILSASRLALPFSQAFARKQQTIFVGNFRRVSRSCQRGFGSKGDTCPHPVELVDRFPTLASVCKPQAPGKLDGVNLQALLTSPRGPTTRAGAVSVVIRNVKGRSERGFSGRQMTLEKDAGPTRRVLGRSLRTQRWCYVEWDGGELGVELYDQ